ncbi:hypothetical protein M0R45_009017 [Rubus argutus]|uniref:Uncharacterized protein n=1 Tax=Rubus argutus TaxID=59490 RepID=A0AAW1Y3I2_RUBAR
MDPKDKVCAETWANPSSGRDLRNETFSDRPPFTNFSSHQHQQKWEDPSILDYGIRIDPSFQKSASLLRRKLQFLATPTMEKILQIERMF